MKKITRLHVPLGVLMFMLIMVIGLAGRGSLADEMNIQDDTSFRRAMLQSSPVFAFEPSDEAIEHWARLWECSSRLDSHTYTSRQSLLMHAIEPLVEQAGSQSLDPIRSIRDSLEATMVDHAERGLTPARETCDWILLNNLLGENERTIEWMSAHDQATVGRLLPRSVREVAQAELGDSIRMDKRGRLLTRTS